MYSDYRTCGIHDSGTVYSILIGEENQIEGVRLQVLGKKET